MSSNTLAEPASAPIFALEDAFCKVDITHSGALIEAMVAMLASHHPEVDAEEARRAVMAREAESPTFVARGISMPHARLDGIERPLVSVATSTAGVSFSGTDDKARLVVLVLTPKCAPAAYLKIAATIARKFKTPGLIDEAVSKDTPEELFNLFNGGERHGGAIVCAADMMSPPVAVLRETNSVKDAIDLIVRTGQTEIPVVDKDGELVGEASADEVMSLCIPDYLLWMEDLSGFSNFEPFAALLRREASTWLADIMSDDYASVSVDQPAIAVAEALARKDAGVCYVTDNGKLAGVVTLPQFLNKVFRD